MNYLMRYLMREYTCARPIELLAPCSFKLISNGIYVNSPKKRRIFSFSSDMIMPQLACEAFSVLSNGVRSK